MQVSYKGRSCAWAGNLRILAAHLEKPHHPYIWEGIVGALSERQARDAALWTLTRLVLSEKNGHRQFPLATAMGAMATFSEVADLPGIEDYRALFRQ